MGRVLIVAFWFFCFCTNSNLIAQSKLKSVVYDFDGLDIGSSDLPDGDYRNNDLTYEISANPLGASDVLGDRVLKLNLNWQNNIGEFGKATMRFVELNAVEDRLNFYFYNPAENSGNASVQIIITEDDNQNNIYEDANDDKWAYNLTIPQSGAWQLLSVPLSNFTDANSGGNGAFDATYSSAGGMLFSIGFIFSKPNAGSQTEQYYIDMICFTEGAMPVGNSILDLPFQNSNAHCSLGALASYVAPDQVPAEIEGMFPAGKKLKYVNWFLYYANTGTTANVFPGQEVQNLINSGYTPVITWETMYAQYPRLDPVQPRLINILNGSLDSYIDAFALKIKSYSGNVILRILHEFEGDWYAWSLTHNNQDPAKYIQAYRYIVDRFRTLGVNNVEWMWCVNAEPKPYVSYNWIISAYPGDSYVDIIATDIYNHPDLGTPAWKSFRYTMTESYYYLSKYFPHKPLYVCEVGCRERNSSESLGSQSKGNWLCEMNKDLKSYFNSTQALVFFSIIKEHDWRINSSPDSKQSFSDCIWSDPFYGDVVDLKENETTFALTIFPNPFKDEIKISVKGFSEATADIIIFDALGKLVKKIDHADISKDVIISTNLITGVYLVELKTINKVLRGKIVRS